MHYHTLSLIVVLLALQYSRADNSCGAFNPSTHICCDGNLLAASGISPSCCGSSSYDATFSICCDGSVYLKSGLMMLKTPLFGYYFIYNYFFL